MNTEEKRDWMTSAERMWWATKSNDVRMNGPRGIPVDRSDFNTLSIIGKADDTIARLEKCIRAFLGSDDHDAPYLVDPDPYPMHCIYCKEMRVKHAPDCPVTMARQLLKHEN